MMKQLELTMDNKHKKHRGMLTSLTLELAIQLDELRVAAKQQDEAIISIEELEEKVKTLSACRIAVRLLGEDANQLRKRVDALEEERVDNMIERVLFRKIARLEGRVREVFEFLQAEGADI